MAGQRKISFTAGGVVALVVVLLLFGGLTGFVPSLPNPFASDTVDNPVPALLVDLRDISEYHAATATLQQIVDLEDDARYVPDFIRGEHVTMLVTGSVDGVVDFSTLTDEAIQVDGKSVTIALPAAEIGVVAIDNEATELLDRNRGLLDRVGDVFSENPGSDQEILVLAEQKIAAAAVETDLLKRAETNTRVMLRSLLVGLGFDDVTVTFGEGVALIR